MNTPAPGAEAEEVKLDEPRENCRRTVEAGFAGRSILALFGKNGACKWQPGAGILAVCWNSLITTSTMCLLVNRFAVYSRVAPRPGLVWDSLIHRVDDSPRGVTSLDSSPFTEARRLTRFSKPNSHTFPDERQAGMEVRSILL